MRARTDAGKRWFDFVVSTVFLNRRFSVSVGDGTARRDVIARRGHCGARTRRSAATSHAPASIQAPFRCDMQSRARFVLFFFFKKSLCCFCFQHAIMHVFLKKQKIDDGTNDLMTERRMHGVVAGKMDTLFGVHIVSDIQICDRSLCFDRTIDFGQVDWLASRIEYIRRLTSRTSPSTSRRRCRNVTTNLELTLLKSPYK